jgi:hypothetical protein
MHENHNRTDRLPAARRKAPSDRLEHRRGARDGELGRAPASMGRAYLVGYAEGRRRSTSRRRSAVSGRDSSDGYPPPSTALASREGALA